MINFEFCSPTKFVFGRGSEAKTGALVKEFGGTNVLVHFGGGSVKKTGVYDKVVASLKTADIAFAELGAKEADIPRLAANLHLGGKMLGAFRPLSESDVREILKLACRS